MKKIILWILAFLLTATTVVYQRLTGPTHPRRGKAYFENMEINYRLPRSHVTTSDCPISLVVPDEDVIGYVEYRAYRTDELWMRSPFERKGDKLTAFIPALPAGGKLEYRVVLFKDRENVEINIPAYELVIIRFRQPVPAPFLILHIITIFMGMLFSTRTGLEALRSHSQPQRLALWTLLFLFLGGLVFGPIVQKYAFGDWWTGFPVGRDLTDTKTLAAFFLWLMAIAIGWTGRPARGWYIAASILTLAVFFIPHSLLGTERRYYPPLPYWDF